MALPFYEQPILNSPYAAPTRHHALDAEGQPLDEPPLPGRRESKLLTPVPKAKKRGGGKQASLALSAEADVDASGQEYNPTPIVNEIRCCGTGATRATDVFNNGNEYKPLHGQTIKCLLRGYSSLL